ncbi:peroxiredoxin [Alphaproteobacteria bacterium KMM 3653]|uniref:Glutathione-dependent peroxiredoxin n=1 Tax=Harenicola maris TaxID=2841044 RepID=A0AAP2G3L1_9RHOB|nr:peroxiredoxin [Harenicola maris]
MQIDVGKTLPTGEFVRIGAEGPETVYLSDLTVGRKVVIFGLPGAFTPTCDSAHVPSFIRTKDQFAEKGVAEIICISNNDAFVMDAWAESTGAKEAGITMLADPTGAFIKEIGMDFDAPPVGLYGRSKRFALIAMDGVVTTLNLEDNPGECDISGGERLLDAL